MLKMVLGAAAIMGAVPGAAQVGVVLQPGETLLEVQTVGETSVAPDVAHLTIGVVSTGTSAKEATDANAIEMTRVIASIREAGIDPRYIRSLQINVQPRFVRTNPADYQGEARISGYVAQNNVVVTVTKLALTSAVVSAAFGAGANSVNGPNLALLDDDKAVLEARRDALAKSRAEAEAYAAGLGMRIARVLRVSERGRSAENVVMASRIMAPPAPPPPPPPPPPSHYGTPVAQGEIRQRVTLWIDYALAPR